MSGEWKLILSSALKNGVFWSLVLMVLTYFKNGLLNWNYLPLWFAFFAVSGGIRRYYLLNKKY